ncbi:hypothetical protein KJ937_05280 [Patescibacteria group bacterium]|nr:hypothetical protein [Patescibacteria group bacterium]
MIKNSGVQLSMMNYKVLITTSGIGQRLGKLTKYTNKALVRIGKKPAISYIVEKYPKDTNFVITLGYFGDQVKDFLSLAYPDRNFEFIQVGKFDGEGSSLGYSMLQAKDALQCPFIYHASDTIIDAVPPLPDKNWIGVFKGNDSSQYATWKIVGNENLIFNDKGAIDFDYIHIGLVGINDYEKYWSTLENLYNENPNNSALNDCDTIVEMIKTNSIFGITKFPVWQDIGNTAALQHARETAPDAFQNLDKLKEDIFLFENFVIKFFYDEKTIKKRVERANILSGLVPEMQGLTKNFYRYEYVKGNLYADIANPDDFSNFLNWAKENLWTKTEGVSDEEFKKASLHFYKDKTEERINKFLDENSIKDEKQIINGLEVLAVSDLLKLIDFDWLSDASQYRIHGDFILDNIIKTADSYCLIDWRQDFGGLLKSGDIYYDLAKLNHNLTVNHDIIHKDLFTINVKKDGSVECDILVKSTLRDCHKVLFNFLEKEGFDKKKVSMLTALIWINMSPLHHHPFNIFLFYFGKYHLYRAIKDTD